MKEVINKRIENKESEEKLNFLSGSLKITFFPPSLLIKKRINEEIKNEATPLIICSVILLKLTILLSRAFPQRFYSN